MTFLSRNSAFVTPNDTLKMNLIVSGEEMKMFLELKTEKNSSLFFMDSLIWEGGVTETLHTEGINYYFP